MEPSLAGSEQITLTAEIQSARSAFRDFSV
jgi:hypothetical protein